MKKNSDQIIKLAQEVLTIEAEEILKTSKSISNNFTEKNFVGLTKCILFAIRIKFLNKKTCQILNQELSQLLLINWV